MGCRRSAVAIVLCCHEHRITTFTFSFAASLFSGSADHLFSSLLAALSSSSFVDDDSECSNSGSQCAECITNVLALGFIVFV
jgi:hypothetical protein